MSDTVAHVLTDLLDSLGTAVGEAIGVSVADAGHRLALRGLFTGTPDRYVAGAYALWGEYALRTLDAPARRVFLARLDATFAHVLAGRQLTGEGDPLALRGLLEQARRARDARLAALPAGPRRVR